MIPKATDVKYTSWPLPEPLTRKIVGYLNIYRMVIALLLGVAHFGGLTAPVAGATGQAFASAILISYLLFAAFHLFSARRPRANCYQLAYYSLITDIAFLSLLVIAYAGVGDGIGILLVFRFGWPCFWLPSPA